MEKKQKNGPQERELEAMPEMAEEATPETVQAEEERTAKQSHGSAFEEIYDKLPDISVRSVDRFIILCVIALIAVILIGVLKANHVF